VNRSKQKGFSLIELMLAMVLGLMLIGGMFTVFTGGLRSSELNQTMARLQSNARFALDMISSDVRMAGFQGCASQRSATLKISTATSPTANLEQTAINGFVVGASSWTPAKPSGYTPPTGVGAPIAGTHALLVQYAALPGNTLKSSMSGRNDQIAISGNAASLFAGDYALISNCDSADLFKIASLSGSGDDQLVQPDESLSQAYAFRLDAVQVTRIMPFVSALYYIGSTERTNNAGDAIRALYLQTFPYDLVNNPPVELIEGVDQLQLSFGVRQPDNSQSFHAPGDAGLISRNVDIIDLGLLMSSNKRLQTNAVDTVYYVANQPLSAVNAASANTPGVYPKDSRMRLPINSRVKIRNRFPL